MSAQTATRYTCRDCGKTYRSFRTEEEWRTSHLADVCVAHGGPKASAPAPAPPVRPQARAARPAPPAAHAPAPARSAPAAQPAPPEPAAPGEALPWWQSRALTVAAVTVAALLLLYVAFDGYRIMADATDAGPKPLQLLIAALIAFPSLYGVYQLGRSAVAAVQADR